MDKSLKIGAVAGLIAGIIAGLIAVFINIPLNFKLGLPYLWYPPPPDTPFMKIAMTEITFNIIWGIVSGIIYSRIYNLIPRRSILKAIIFGLGLYLIVEVRGAFFSIVYGWVQEAITGLVQIWFWTVFGLVLGISYEFLLRKYSVKKEKLRIIKPDLRNGIHPGAIAGFFGGIGVFILNIIIFNRELFPYMTDISFLISQMGAHAFFNLIWGIVIGIFFVMFYEKIPGKGISKGMVYGIIIFFFTSFPFGLVEIAYGEPMLGYWYCIGGFTSFFIFGIIIGALYKAKK